MKLKEILGKYIVTELKRRGSYEILGLHEDNALDVAHIIIDIMLDIQEETGDKLVKIPTNIFALGEEAKKTVPVVVDVPVKSKLPVAPRTLSTEIEATRAEVFAECDNLFKPSGTLIEATPAQPVVTSEEPKKKVGHKGGKKHTLAKLSPEEQALKPGNFDTLSWFVRSTMVATDKFLVKDFSELPKTPFIQQVEDAASKLLKNAIQARLVGVNKHASIEELKTELGITTFEQTEKALFALYYLMHQDRAVDVGRAVKSVPFLQKWVYCKEKDENGKEKTVNAGRAKQLYATFWEAYEVWRADLFGTTSIESVVPEELLLK